MNIPFTKTPGGNFDASVIACKFDKVEFTSTGNLKYNFTVTKNDGGTLTKMFFVNVPKADALDWQVKNFGLYGIGTVANALGIDLYADTRIEKLEQTDYKGLAEIAMEQMNAKSGAEVVIYGSYKGTVVDGILVVDAKNMYNGRPNLVIGNWNWCCSPSDAKPWMSDGSKLAVNLVKEGKFKSNEVQDTVDTFGETSDLPF